VLNRTVQGDESIQTIILPIPRFPQTAYGTAVSGAGFGFDKSAD
jgi:hypothetical protein